MDETKEYGETHYYKQTIEGRGINKKTSKFWEHYAYHCLNPKTPNAFISSRFWECTSSLPDIIGCMSVLSLPMRAHSQDSTYTKITDNSKSGTMQLEITGSMMMVSKQIGLSLGKEPKGGVLVGEKMWKYGQGHVKGRVINEGEEILINTLLRIEVVMSNMREEELEISCLVQIPAGAIPLALSIYSQSKIFNLSPYSTTTYQYSFYFPTPGHFEHYGATVSIAGSVIARAKSTFWIVVDTRTIISSEHFINIVANGNKTNILKFIEEKNIYEEKYGFSWKYIYWMIFGDREFYMALMNICKRKYIYVPSLWAYAFKHNHTQGIKEYLESDNIIKDIIGPINSELLTISEMDLKLQHLDYYPLINPRAHSVILRDYQGNIRNETFKKTYQKFILYLAEKHIRHWNIKDKLNLIQYLFLQERIEEAIRVFEEVSAQIGDRECGIQMDYIKAYVDFLTGYPKFDTAEYICIKYLDYPILTWRVLFTEMHQQLEEFEGKSVGKSGKSDKSPDQDANIEYTEDIEIEEGSLSVELRNTNIYIEFTQKNGPPEIEFHIKYYLIDLEVLFSRKPELFLGGGGISVDIGETQDLSFVQPHYILRERVNMIEGLAILNIPIEQEFLTKNILFEIIQNGVQNKYLTYYSNKLKIHIYENYGEIKVLGSNIEVQEKLTKVYVKCFAKMNNGDFVFYKDGYTDIRGRFDYLSLNSPKFRKVQLFALYVAHPLYGNYKLGFIIYIYIYIGSTVKIANPPAAPGRRNEK